MERYIPPPEDAWLHEHFRLRQQAIIWRWGCLMSASAFLGLLAFTLIHC